MKTAVEWLIEQISESSFEGITYLNVSVKNEILEMAKKIEKGQITNAYDIAGMKSVLYDENQEDGEDYYNYLINDFSE